MLPGNNAPTVNVTLPASGTDTTRGVCPVTTDCGPFAAGNTVNDKYAPLHYPSLGGAVFANYPMGNTADLVNPIQRLSLMRCIQSI